MAGDEETNEQVHATGLRQMVLLDGAMQRARMRFEEDGIPIDDFFHGLHIFNQLGQLVFQWSHALTRHGCQQGADHEHPGEGE